MRVAYYSPLPPQRSGIADYSALLLPALDGVSRSLSRGPFRRSSARTSPSSSSATIPSATAGSTSAPSPARASSSCTRSALHGLIAGLTLGRGDREAYLAAVERDGGVEARLRAERALAGLDPPLWETQRRRDSALREALDFARGVVVHSHYAEQTGAGRRLRGAGPPGRLSRLPLAGRRSFGAVPGRTLARDRLARQAQLREANPSAAPRVLAVCSGAFPDALLVLAGDGFSPTSDKDRLEPLGLEAGNGSPAPRLSCPRAGFHALVARSDICISLRSPTLGETSASAISALAAGTPLVVSDVGWFKELPDAVAAKVAPDEWEVDAPRRGARAAGLRRGRCGRRWAQAGR